MQLLLAMALMAGLLLPIESLPFSPLRSTRLADRVRRLELVGDREQRTTVEDRPDEAVEMTVEWGLFTRQFIQQRLEALAAELERLDDDPDVFAKAFHTNVARSAYQALLLEASTLSDRPCPPAGHTVHVELVGPSTGLTEVLEL